LDPNLNQITFFCPEFADKFDDYLSGISLISAMWQASKLLNQKSKPIRWQAESSPKVIKAPPTPLASLIPEAGIQRGSCLANKELGTWNLEL
jgi:hypothetical protein